MVPFSINLVDIMGMNDGPITETMLESTRWGLGRDRTETHRVVALAGDPRSHSRTASLASALAVRLAREVVGNGRSDASWRLIELGGAG